MNFKLLLSLPVIGCFIEWIFVVCFDAGIAIYWSPVIREFNDDMRDRFGVGWLWGFLVWSTIYSYAQLPENPLNLSFYLWQIRVGNMLLQVVHGCLFGIAMSIGTHWSFALAPWIYIGLQLLILVTYGMYRSYLALKVIFVAEYNSMIEYEALKKEELHKED